MIGSSRVLALAVSAALALVVSARADQDATRSQQTAKEKVDVQPLKARAIEVAGDVKTAPVGTSPLAGDAWKAVQVNDELAAGTLIRTGIRSHLILRFGDDTIINVKRVTLASIDAFYKTGTTKTARLGLGYGAIRGGSTEGTLRSDLVIDSTVATLAKRGTQGFEMSVEPYTGRFAISLAREGLVEALEKATGRRKLVRPGEYANELNIARMWIKQDQFDRRISFRATEALTVSDLDQVVTHRRGFGVIAPAAGNQTLAFVRPRGRDAVTAGVLQQFAQAAADRRIRLPELAVIQGTGPVRRPEGNFGISDPVRVLVPQADLSQFTRPRSSRGGFGRRLRRR